MTQVFPLLKQTKNPDPIPISFHNRSVTLY